MTEIWTPVERPGYLGKKRDEVQRLWDEKYGQGNWRISYQWGSLIIPRREAISIYEDGYYEFFKRCQSKRGQVNLSENSLEWLIQTASDVYDTSPTNVESGFDYEKQETPNNHIHDIAIRRSIMRLGEWFNGDHLVHVRWVESEGFRINPGVVPFHLPNLIVQGEINDYGGKGLWWRANTIEDFYQRNKILEVKQ